MLHAAEGPGEVPDHLVGHQSVHRGDGGQVVFNVVDPRQLDIPGVHHRPLLPVAAGDHRRAPEEHAIGHLPLPGEQPHPARRLGGEGERLVIVRIENRNILRCLMCKDICLCSNILCIVLMDVQMIGREVGHHGDVGALGHGHELEGAQLQHRHVPRGDGARLRQQRMADVAPQVHRPPRPLQKLGDDGGGGGLAVAARDSDHRAGTHLEKRLHLRGQLAAPGHGRRQPR